MITSLLFVLDRILFPVLSTELKHFSNLKVSQELRLPSRQYLLNLKKPLWSRLKKSGERELCLLQCSFLKGV